MRRYILLMMLAMMGFMIFAADLSGIWNAEVTLDQGSGVAKFELKQTGDVLTGSYAGSLGGGNVKGSIKGDQVEWSFDSNEAGKIQYKGTLDSAGKIKGTVDYGQLGKGTFTATKKS